jgi:hypothetical protein
LKPEAAAGFRALLRDGWNGDVVSYRGLATELSIVDVNTLETQDADH